MYFKNYNNKKCFNLEIFCGFDAEYHAREMRGQRVILHSKLESNKKMSINRRYPVRLVHCVLSFPNHICCQAEN